MDVDVQCTRWVPSDACVLHNLQKVGSLIESTVTERRTQCSLSTVTCKITFLHGDSPALLLCTTCMTHAFGAKSELASSAASVCARETMKSTCTAWVLSLQSLPQSAGLEWKLHAGMSLRHVKECGCLAARDRSSTPQCCLAIVC